MLKWIKRLLFIALLAVAIIIGVVFTSENNHSISLVVFSFPLPELSVGLWVFIALLVGAIIGLLVSSLPVLFSRYTHSNKDKKILQLQKELNTLRISGLKR
jgi:putative membrane protein